MLCIFHLASIVESVVLLLAVILVLMVVLLLCLLVLMVVLFLAAVLVHLESLPPPFLPGPVVKLFQNCKNYIIVCTYHIEFLYRIYWDFLQLAQHQEKICLLLLLVLVQIVGQMLISHLYT